MAQQTIDAGKLRHPVERWMFGVCVVVSIVLFVSVLLLAFARDEVIAIYAEDALATYRQANPEAANLSDEEVMELLPAEERETIEFLKEYLSPVLILLVPVGIVLLVVWSFGREYGRLRANAVRITARQFPEVHAMWAELTRAVGLKEVPHLYTVNGDGSLNAFAACVPWHRNFSAIYSDLLETCLRNEDWDSLKFILGHEAGHIRLGHVSWWYILLTFIYQLAFPISYIIGLPLSRAREYGCDKVGHAIAQDLDCKGLLMLTAGKHLYHGLDVPEHIEESVEQGGLWLTIVNFMSTHPVLAWRINAIRKGHNGGVIFRRA